MTRGSAVLLVVASYHKYHIYHLFLRLSYKHAELLCSYNFCFLFAARVQELKPAEQDEFLDSSPNLEPWQIRFGLNLDRASHDSIPLESREPDGASSEEYPAISEEDHDDVEKKNAGVLSSSEDVYLKDAKGKKKKRHRSLLACLGPARLSFRKKSERAKESKTDTARLVKEI